MKVRFREKLVLVVFKSSAHFPVVKFLQDKADELHRMMQPC